MILERKSDYFINPLIASWICLTNLFYQSFRNLGYCICAINFLKYILNLKSSPIHYLWFCDGNIYIMYITEYNIMCHTFFLEFYFGRKGYILYTRIGFWPISSDILSYHSQTQPMRYQRLLSYHIIWPKDTANGIPMSVIFPLDGATGKCNPLWN